MDVNIEESGGGSHIAPKSKHNEVEKFFPVSVDNFFDNPDRIVKYAKSLPKEPDPEGGWAGIRSEVLWKIDDELNTALLLKILSCYYDMSYQDISWKISDMRFQEISTFSKNKNDVKNKGWIHIDHHPTKGHTHNEIEVAGLIYLTPDIDPDSGTSLFTLKQRNNGIIQQPLKYLHQRRYFTKHLLNKNKNISNNKEEFEEFDEAYFIKKYKEHEEDFIEKTRFANIYNRMLMYDTNEFHRANSYYSGDGKDARLTLVFFIGGLNVELYPLEKIKGGEYDEFIEYRTKVKQ